MKLRLIIGAVMLILAFIGMVLTDVYQGGSFDYWKWIVPVYALLALSLSLYDKRPAPALWKEALHWASLFGMIFLTSHFATLGIMSRFLTGIVHLSLISLTVFLAGIYIDPTFLVIGLILALFTFLAAAFVEYIYAISLPILLASILVLGIYLYLAHRKRSHSQM